MSKNRRPATGVACALLIGAMVLVPVQMVQADPIVTIADRNASATFDLGSDMGMYDWTLAGTDHLYQQWFWIRVGDGDVMPINDLGLFGSQTIDTNLDGFDDQLSLRYDDDITRIDATFLLRGSGTGSPMSTLTEMIRVENLTDAAVQISLFQYADFDLGGTITDEMVSVTLPDSVLQTDEATGGVLESNVGPDPNHYAAAYSSLTGLPGLLGTNGHLRDVAGPLGPGDLAWAFEWDFTLAPSGVFNLSKDKAITPEPTTGLLLAMGGAALIRRKRR